MAFPCRAGGSLAFLSLSEDNANEERLRELASILWRPSSATGRLWQFLLANDIKISQNEPISQARQPGAASLTNVTSMPAGLKVV